MPDFAQFDQEVRQAYRPNFDDVVAKGVRRRTRTRRRVAVVACGLAVLVAGGGAVALSTRSPADQAIGTPSTAASVGPMPLAMPDLANLKPLAQEWPHAVRRLPDRLPGGATYSIVKALGGDKYLVHGSRALWIYHLGTNQAVRLMDEPRAQPAAWVSGDWVISYAPTTNSKYDITAIRLSGGEPVRVASDIPAGDGPVVVNGYLVWSDGSILWRAPITGGGPVTVYPGGAGWRVEGSVWAAKWRMQGRFPGREMPVPSEVWNLQTGEKRTFVPPPDVWRYEGCSPSWCLVLAMSGKWSVQRFDGARYTEGSGTNGILHLLYESERFVTGHVDLPDKGWYGVLWDVESGRAAYGGGRIDADGFWEPRPESRVVPLDNDSFTNRKHHILDLTAL